LKIKIKILLFPSQNLLLTEEMLSDSSISQGAADRHSEKGLKPKAIKWILVALSTTTLFCVVTIFILFSKLKDHSTLEDSVSSLNKQFKTNAYLNPLEFSTEWDKSFSLTPQTLDSNTNYTDLYGSSTSTYFLWNSQSGGYGTCEFVFWIENCNKCQFSVKGALNRAALYPLKNFTTSSSLAYTVDFNFVLAQSSNSLGVSLALIGDSSQGPVPVTISNLAYCSVFGVQT